MGVTTSGFDSSIEVSIDDTIVDVLPEGNTTFEIQGPTVGTTGFDSSIEKGVGIFVSGFVRRGTNSIDGEARMLFGDEVLKTASPSGASYMLTSSPPSGITSGESKTPRPGTLFETQFEGEGGSFANKTSSAPDLGEFRNTFFDLTITVQDVDGNNLASESITIDSSVDRSTGADGTYTLGASGSTDVAGLRDSRTETVNVGEGGETVILQYAGVSGNVRGAGGSPINGVLVKLLDSDGNEIARTTTDSNGDYKFKRAPVNTDLQVQAIGITRSFTSSGEGVEQTKNIPLDPSGISSILVECVDAETGRSIVDVDCTIGSNTSYTDTDGVGVMSTTETGDITLVVAAEDGRYERYTVEEELNEGENVSVQIELVPRTASTRA